MIGRAILCGLVYLFGVSSSAVLAEANTVGTAIVDGRKATLYSDKTWDFADAKEIAEGCAVVAKVMAFCGSPEIWTETNPPNKLIARQYRYDAGNYAQIIVEAIGSDQGVTADLMRNAILTNAGSALGVPASEVPIIDVWKTEIDKSKGEALAFSVTVSGTPVVFVTTFVITNNTSVQATTFNISQELTNDHRTLHALFLKNLRFRKAVEN